MIHIGRDKYTFTFSPNHKPAATAAPGETVVFETRDGADGQILTGEENLDELDVSRGNPVTGPLSVLEANPGDTLAVKIIDIKLAPQGFLAVIAGRGVLKMDTKITIPKIVNNKVIFNENISVPVVPMIGTIGTSPDVGEVAANYPGNYGGNMDNIDVTIDSIVYLPVRVKGALLSLGDVHANQGDGELMASSLEIESVVTVSVDVIKNKKYERPWIETPSSWVTCADALTLPEAIRIATEDMVNLLGEKMELCPQDAYMYISLTGGVKICQACEWLINPTVRVVAPKP